MDLAEMLASAKEEGIKEGRKNAIDEILNLKKHNHYDSYGDLMYQSIKVDDIEQLKEKNKNDSCTVDL